MPTSAPHTPTIPAEPGSTRFLSQVVAHLRVLIFRLRIAPVLQFEYFSTALTEISGYQREDLLDQPRKVFKLLPPEEYQRLLGVFAQAGSHEVSLMLRHKNGLLIPGRLSFTSIFRSTGNLVAVDAIFVPHSHRSDLIDEDILANPEEIRKMVHTNRSPLAVYSITDGIFQDLNPAFQDLLSISRLELLSRPFYQLNKLESQNDTAILKNSVETGQIPESIQPTLKAWDGRTYALKFSPQNFSYMGKNCLLVEMVDLSLSVSGDYALKQVEILSQAAVKIGGAKTAEGVYHAIGQAAEELFPDYHMIMVARYHAEREEITCVCALADGGEMDVSGFPPMSVAPDGPGPNAEAIHGRKILIVADLVARLKQADKVVYVGNEEESDIPRSGLYVPMIAAGSVQGVIIWQSSQLDRFTQSDANIAAALAGMAAGAVRALDTPSAD